MENKKKDRVDRITGSIVEIKSINDELSEIYLDGKNWSGKSSEDLEVGEKAEVIGY